ncbi:bile acid:sodium symporter family protein [Halobaculum lipolyticum]|uniref:Bile acid:sodium symporter family protein n=1 Tax=Halobaculum lipolyticum TaxID=3032001 RepID=A0ABD5W5L5_9EURY|nr:bile acid:sodium symporter [Halobaculum sp. DT31]
MTALDAALLTNLTVIAFVASSMLAMGLRLTVAAILDPLRDRGLVARALVANFVLVPASAFAIVAVAPVSTAQSVGVVLLATAAGAPFLPKLVEAADGDVPFGVGLMVLLMVLTVAYVPIVLPILLPGVSVNPLDIAGSLVVLMLLPLAAGLAVTARYPEVAGSLQPTVNQASNTSLILLVVLVVAVNARTLLEVVGTGVLVALAALVVASFAIGWGLGGPTRDRRTVLGLGTAQRNVSAALVVGAQNFADPDVLSVVVAGSMLMLVVLLPLGGELGRRSGVPAADAGDAEAPTDG